MTHLITGGARSGKSRYAEQLAIKDGFSSADELFRWVSANHGNTLSGNLIEW